MPGEQTPTELALVAGIEPTTAVGGAGDAIVGQLFADDPGEPLDLHPIEEIGLVGHDDAPSTTAAATTAVAAVALLTPGQLLRQRPDRGRPTPATRPSGRGGVSLHGIGIGGDDGDVGDLEHRRDLAGAVWFRPHDDHVDRSDPAEEHDPVDGSDEPLGIRSNDKHDPAGPLEQREHR